MGALFLSELGISCAGEASNCSSRKTWLAMVRGIPFSNSLASKGCDGSDGKLF